MMPDMVIAKCPYCGAERFSWCEDDAAYKYYKHKCMATLLDKELHEIISRIIKMEDKS